MPTLDQARHIVATLDGVVDFYKIGMWLLFQPGADRLIDDLVASGKQVFLDYKLYDIGETVRAGVRAVAARGARFITVHGEPDIMRAAVDGAAGTSLGILAVTVLTNMDDAAIAAAGYSMTVRDLVQSRVRHAAEAGCEGVICSALDEPNVLRGGSTLRFITPGIRLPGDPQGDQRRTATPQQALRAGADYLVVGRPIVQAPDTLSAALRVIDDMAQA